MKHTHGQRTYVALLLLLSALLIVTLALAALGARVVHGDIREKEADRAAAQDRSYWNEDTARYYDRDLNSMRPPFRISVAATVWAALYAVYTLGLLGARLFAHYAPPVRIDWPLQVFWLVWGVVTCAVWVNPGLHCLNDGEWGLWATCMWIWGIFAWIVVAFTLARLLAEVIVVGRRSKRLSYWDTEAELHGLKRTKPADDDAGLNKAAKEDA